MRQVHYAILQLIEISQVSVNKNEHNAYRFFTSEVMTHGRS